MRLRRHRRPEDRPVGLSPEHDLPCNDAQKPQPEEATVVVTSPREIKIDGRRYVRCK